MVIALGAMLAIVVVAGLMGGSHGGDQGLSSNGAVPSVSEPFSMGNSTFLSFRPMSVEASIAIAVDIGMVVFGLFIALKDD